ncbi:MAG: helix-turn-helix domain-containing protein [Candidatus Binatia bacterium]
MTFGKLLKQLREERGLSLRELSSLCRPSVDHAYIYRLEAGEKTTPSEGVVQTLARALKLSGQKLLLFKFLAEEGEIPDSLVELVLDEAAKIKKQELESLAHLSSRGRQPKSTEDWHKALTLLRKYF